MIALILGWVCVCTFAATCLIVVLGLWQRVLTAPWPRHSRPTGAKRPSDKYFDRLFWVVIVELAASVIGWFTGGLTLSPGSALRTEIRLPELETLAARTAEPLREVGITDPITGIARLCDQNTDVQKEILSVSDAAFSGDFFPQRVQFAQILFSRGLAYAAEGLLNDAYSSVDLASKFDPGVLAYEIRAGDILRAMRQYGKAIDRYAAAESRLASLAGSRYLDERFAVSVGQSIALRRRGGTLFFGEFRGIGEADLDKAQQRALDAEALAAREKETGKATTMRRTAHIVLYSIPWEKGDYGTALSLLESYTAGDPAYRRYMEDKAAILVEKGRSLDAGKPTEKARACREAYALLSELKAEYESLPVEKRDMAAYGFVLRKLSEAVSLGGFPDDEADPEGKIRSLIGSLLELKGKESPDARSPSLRYALALLYMAQKPPDRSSALASIGDAVALETARQSDIYNYDPVGLSKYLELQASIKSSAVASVQAVAPPYALQLSADRYTGSRFLLAAAELEPAALATFHLVGNGPAAPMTSLGPVMAEGVTIGQKPAARREQGQNTKGDQQGTHKANPDIRDPGR